MNISEADGLDSVPALLEPFPEDEDWMFEDEEGIVAEELNKEIGIQQAKTRAET